MATNEAPPMRARTSLRLLITAGEWEALSIINVGHECSDAWLSSAKLPKTGVDVVDGGILGCLALLSFDYAKNRWLKI